MAPWNGPKKHVINIHAVIQTDNIKRGKIPHRNTNKVFQAETEGETVAPTHGTEARLRSLPVDMRLEARLSGHLKLVLRR